MKKIFIFTLALMLCCSFIVSPSFADTVDYPSPETFINERLEDFVAWPDVDKSKLEHIIYSKDSKIYLTVLYDYNDYITLWNAEFTGFVNESNQSYVNLVFEDNGMSRKAYFNSVTFSLEGTGAGKYWALSGVINEIDSFSLNNVIDNVFYTSTFDILNSDGDVFFPEPPAGLEVVIQEEMKIQEAKIQATMMTILLCGVGCLALLIILHLLYKVLRNFLAR